jgi:hypothetical protein
MVLLSVFVILNSLMCNSCQHRELADETKHFSASEIIVLRSVCVILNSLMCKFFTAQRARSSPMK